MSEVEILNKILKLKQLLECLDVFRQEWECISGSTINNYTIISKLSVVEHQIHCTLATLRDELCELRGE